MKQKLGENFSEFKVNIKNITVKNSSPAFKIFKHLVVDYNGKECVVMEINNDGVELLLLTNNPKDFVYEL